MTGAVTSDSLRQATEQLIAFGRAAAEAGLLASTCGNASVRVGDDDMLISASGSSVGALQPTHVTLVGIADGAVKDGPKPSMELDIHRRVYLARPRCGAVLHCQSRAATLVCCMQTPPSNLDLIPEIPAYVRRHAFVDYAQPGSQKLAEDVAGALSDADVTIVQMRNHGQVIIGGRWQNVVRRATFFELACSFATQGHPLRTIPEAEAAALRDYARDV